MTIPNWIRKRFSRNDILEYYAEGRLEVFDKKNKGYESKRGAAIVGTTNGIYFIAKSFFSSGFAHFNNWEEFLGKAYIHSKIGVFNSKIIIEIKDFVIVLNTTKYEANNFVSYIASIKSQLQDYSRISHFTTSSDIVNSINALKQLLDQGIITNEEFEIKKAKLLKRL